MTQGERNAILQAIDREVIPRLNRIEEQVRATNGRVNALEAERDQRKGYDSRVDEEQALERADTLSWRAVIVPGTVAVVVTVLAIVAQQLFS
jgi:TolA-binding protein